MQEERLPEIPMSTELIDLRAKITDLADAVLDVQRDLTGKDRSEIVRDVLHEWATRKASEASLLCKTLTAKGFNGKGGGE